MEPRPISTLGLENFPHPTDFGSAAMLQWLKIADLVVDPSYQREITGTGRQNIRRITAEFSWSKFAPVIVSPVEGGKYAIVDGQHRTTAAAICGLEQVPCAVILLDRTGQAAAFKAINGATTKMSAMAMFHAAVLSGDPDAVAIKEVCDCAGVTALRYPVAANFQKPGETMAVTAIERMFKRHGRDTLITALQCITETGENTGLLVAPIITAICEVLSENPEWRDAGSKLLEAFDEIDLEAELAAARTVSAQKRNIGVAVVLANRLRELLTQRLGAPVETAEAA
ncbi:hypothetical protein AA309_20020 [Microvirga vignae]|uniref:ParB-like N-terminal domain-containing protein n=2 Tax=Microvirga vignae TaxID=1225564 RepID=A0A0H1R984_9HYPH|nr:hypothetical protein AA309_20020 [Microvirga vignae]